MSAITTWRRALARWIAPRSGGTRMYAAARNTRLTTGWGTSNSSADTELSASLTALRSRSRQLMRDAAYAKRARVIIVNNVVGAGVGLQAQVKNSRGGLNERINASIENAWQAWSRADSCHTGGTLTFSDFERTCMSEVVTAGEVFIRKHYRTFGRSKIPLALELIEAERVCDEITFPQTISKADVRMGVEVDGFGRPIAYWMRERHPGELKFMVGEESKLIRVPADEIIHLRVIDRWPQTRGEPWLHAAAGKLNDMNGYSDAEITAARAAACYMGIIEQPDLDQPLGEPQADGTQQLELAPGAIERLGMGERMNWNSPNRPNSAFSEFMRAMLRETAAGIGVSYESLSRDYSQSNYSSSRLALLDDRDLWRVLQQWWIRAFREPLHAEWMNAAVLSRAIPAIDIASFMLNTEQYLPVTWKLRGWSWIDPVKEVTAYKDAVKAGFTTISAVIAQTAGGIDIEDVIAERKRELEMFEAAGIEVDTTVEEPEEVAAAPQPVQQEPAEAEDDDENEDEPQTARVVKIKREA